MNKNHWLDIAELVDSFRIFPRLFLIACFFWSADTCYEMLHWYTKLPDSARGLEATGFASVVCIAILGFLKLVYTTYSDAGRSWGPPPATTESTSATMVTSSTTVPTLQP